MAKKKEQKAKSIASKEAKMIATTEKPSVKVVKKEKSNAGFDFNNITKEVSSPKFLAKITAELIGTFLLTSIVIATQGQPIGILFGIMAVVLMVGAISGAHINPAITAGAWATKKIRTLDAIGYIIAQFVGAMLSFVLLSSFINAVPASNPEALQLGQAAAPSIFKAAPIAEKTALLVLLAEFIGMSIFAFGVANVAKKSNSTSVALGVGGSLFVAILLAGSTAALLQASSIFNPAIAVALQAFSVEGTNTVWAVATYLGAALLGGIFGFGLEALLTKAAEEK